MRESGGVIWAGERSFGLFTSQAHPGGPLEGSETVDRKLRAAGIDQVKIVGGEIRLTSGEEQGFTI